MEGHKHSDKSRLRFVCLRVWENPDMSCAWWAENVHQSLARCVCHCFTANPKPALMSSATASAAKRARVDADVSERKLLADAVNNISKSQVSFATAVDVLQTLNSSAIGDLDRAIAVKRQELQDVSDELDRKVKNGQLDKDQQIKEYGRRAALEILKQTGEVAVREDEYTALQTQLGSLQRKDQAEKDALAAQIKEKHNRKMQAALKAQELGFKATDAETKAVSQQQTREIESLKQQIVTLSGELRAQRELTQKVAEASRPQAVQYGGEYGQGGQRK